MRREELWIFSKWTLYDPGEKIRGIRFRLFHRWKWADLQYVERIRFEIRVLNWSVLDSFTSMFIWILIWITCCRQSLYLWRADYLKDILKVDNVTDRIRSDWWYQETYERSFPIWPEGCILNFQTRDDRNKGKLSDTRISGTTRRRCKTKKIQERQE